MIRVLLTTFGVGFLYLIGAIPAGVLMGLPLIYATFFAWLGYSFGGLIVIVIGKPLSDFLQRIFRISTHPNPDKLFWKAWHRFGLWGLGLLAPLTVGPQVAAIIGLSLHAPKLRLFLAIALGCLPTAVGISILLVLGIRIAT